MTPKPASFTGGHRVLWTATIPPLLNAEQGATMKSKALATFWIALAATITTMIATRTAEAQQGKKPHIDQLARQGMLFTDYYAEASCTAGRASFITGQIPLRTGLTTVGQAG